MIPQALLDNFQSWDIQVLLIGSIGALLPAFFRIRHPRSQLTYCHGLLLLSIILPIVEPWKHTVIVIAQSAEEAVRGAEQASVPGSMAFAASFHGRSYSIWVLFSGIVARLCWTAIGLWRIQRHRIAAEPLYPVPEPVQEAIARVGVNAAFCLSSNGLGPVTFGFFRPVVLLPESFLTFDRSAQCGIACHELLHVKRHDWLITVVEEVIAALFWFHPAFWWLLGQVRLSREQIVDAEVVRIISDREPYINALLAIAGAQRGLDLAPAPLFLRRRHLLQRMHLLVTEVSMSRFRLISSYGSMFIILAGVGWLGFASFPLVGRAEIREPARRAAASVQPPQNGPGYVVNIQPLRYPPEAAQKKIEGTVAVELTFNASGNIVDSRVLSGPEELRAAALESAVRGNYSINVARTLQVLVEFKLRPGVLAQAPPPPPPPPPPGENKLDLVIDHIDIRGLSEPQLSDLRRRLDVFVGGPLGSAPIQQTIREAGLGFPYAIRSKKIDDGKISLDLAFGSEATVAPEFVKTPFGTTGVVGGTIMTPFGPVANPRANGAADNSADSAPFVPDLRPISTVNPVYPPLARQARIEGIVVMRALIDTEGKVDNLRVISGHPLMI